LLPESAAQPATNSTFCHSVAESSTSLKDFVLANGFQAHADVIKITPAKLRTKFKRWLFSNYFYFIERPSIPSQITLQKTETLQPVPSQNETTENL
jgi:hypothetical protein